MSAGRFLDSVHAQSAYGVREFFARWHNVLLNESSGYNKITGSAGADTKRQIGDAYRHKKPYRITDFKSVRILATADSGKQAVGWLTFGQSGWNV